MQRLRNTIDVLGSLLLAIVALTMAGPADAHRTGESYVYVDVTETSLSGSLHLDLSHLNQVVSLDRDKDGSVSIEEFNRNKEKVVRYFSSRLKFFDDTNKYKVRFLDHEFFLGDKWVSINFEVPDLVSPPEYLDAKYKFLYDTEDPQHRGLLLIRSNTRSGIEHNEAQHSLIFAPGREQQNFRLDGVPWTTVFFQFVVEGIIHIVPRGQDHILFIVSLLITAVLVREANEWTPADSFGRSAWRVIEVITVFTLAHTVTLTLAALNLVRLPIMLVEAVIALSIAVVAASNIFGFLDRRTWVIVFALGLFHGFGFANVLDPIWARGATLLPALAGFNIGVEIGQLLVIAVVFPVLFLFRNTQAYTRYFVPLGSAALILVAAVWLVERTFLSGAGSV